MVGAVRWRAVGTHARDVAAAGGAGLPQWDTVYSTCWYTMEALTDTFIAKGEAPPVIGFLEVAVGGTKISQWVERGAAAACTNQTCCCQYDCQPEYEAHQLELFCDLGGEGKPQ